MIEEKVIKDIAKIFRENRPDGNLYPSERRLWYSLFFDMRGYLLKGKSSVIWEGFSNSVYGDKE